MQRKKGADAPTILALHPGEVMTDMADIEIAWDVPNPILADESVEKMLEVIAAKGHGGTEEGGRARAGEASFWTWEGKRMEW